MMSQKDFDVYDPMDDYDDYPSNEEKEEMKRGYVRPPRRYRAKDDSEHFYEPPVFEKEVGR
jgi:hypothetical protein